MIDIDFYWKQLDKDAPLNPACLEEDLFKIPQLQVKYIKFKTKENNILAHKEAEYKNLNLEKYDYYVNGLNENTKKKGWPPIKNKILKSEVDRYLDADQDLNDLRITIAQLKELVKNLEYFLSHLAFRYNIIKETLRNRRSNEGQSS